MLKKIFETLIISILAFLSALNYCIFVFPNKFAPAGVDGIGTMIQDIFNINLGYFSLFINIPLIIIAFIKLNREFAVKTTIYIIVFSLASIFLKTVNLSSFCYITESGTSVVLAPIASGAIRGLLYALTLKLNGSAGGIDLISSIIKKKKPHLDFMNVIFIINIFIASCSYFVYGMKLEPVICSIIYSFVTSQVCNTLRKSENETVKYEIITQSPEKLCEDINKKLSQRATIIDAHGSYSNQDTKVVFCVTPKSKTPFLEELILNYPDCIVFKSNVKNAVSGITYK